MGSLRRASHPCDELPPASAAGEEGDACGTEEEIYLLLSKGLYGNGGNKLFSPENTLDLGREWELSACPKGAQTLSFESFSHGSKTSQTAGTVTTANTTGIIDIN